MVLAENLEGWNEYEDKTGELIKVNRRKKSEFVCSKKQQMERT